MIGLLGALFSMSPVQAQKSMYQGRDFNLAICSITPESESCLPLASSELYDFDTTGVSLIPVDELDYSRVQEIEVKTSFGRGMHETRILVEGADSQTFLMEIFESGLGIGGIEQIHTVFHMRPARKSSRCLVIDQDSARAKYFSVKQREELGLSCTLFYLLSDRSGKAEGLKLF